MIIAVCGTSAGTSARRRSARLRLAHAASLPRLAAMLGRDVRVEPVADRRQMRLGEVALEQAPHARLEAAVVRLAVALPQPGEDAEDARVALRRERPIGALERLAVPGRRDIAVDHRALDRRRDVAPRILQHRGEIVGRVAGERVLEIEQAEMRDALAALDQHDVLGMIVAQHGHRARARRRRPAPAPRARPRDSRRHRPRAPTAGQYQSVNSFSSSSHWSRPCGLKPGHRRVLVEVDEHVGRELVQLALARRVVVERLAQPRSRRNRRAAAGPCRGRGRGSRGALRPRRRSHSATAMNGRGSSCGGGASISTALRSPSTTRK